MSSAMASVAVAATPRTRSRLGKKEKQQLKLQQHGDDDDDDAAATRRRATTIAEPLDYYSLSNQQTRYNKTCPVVFSRDSLYSFVAVGSQVNIYSTESLELLSTLTVASRRRAQVTAVLLNPTNSLQLLVGAADGSLSVWDYTEGKLLRTLDLGSAILHACGHATLPDQLFVALAAAEAPSASESKDVVNKGKRSTKAAPEPSSSSDYQLAGVYSISLRPKAPSSAESSAPVDPSTPRTPARRMRLAQPRIVRALGVSPAGHHLVSVNPNTINVCQTQALQRGFELNVDSDGDALTTLAFHPSENYFATGDERGKIRVWYDVLRDETLGPGQGDDEAMSIARPASAVFHWHAHAVASLAFTPNGAYLLSGGQEAVLVLWQLHTGHQEYVPRLGAPILALSILDNGMKEQQVAARLRDGSVVFVGSQKLKISKTIAGLKADPSRGVDFVSRPAARVPLALQPMTNSLVLPAGHPSSIQFYSPVEDSQKMEIEVSPSNRVSSAGARPLEPTHVELVAFSKPSREGGIGAYWMATHDSWENGSFAPSRHLKFWHNKGHGSTFSLTTRIDRPHDSRITSMSFSPSTSASSPPLLLTTSLDNRIKLWSLDAGTSTWSCRTALSYRGFTPRDAAWSMDGSMFAVAHDQTVTLWSLADLKLIHAFPSQAIGSVRSVAFVGEEGTGLVAGGEHGSTVWDLLTFEETLNMAFEVGSITAKPRSATFIALEKPKREHQPVASTSAAVTAPSSSSTSAASTSTAFIVTAPSGASLVSSAAACTPRQLPFPVRQSLWLPTPSTSASSSAPQDEQISLAVVAADRLGQIALLGAASAVGQGVLPSRLPSARSRKDAGQSRLFDEIFGSAEDGGQKTKKAVKPAAVSTSGDRKGKSTLSALLSDTPAHSLPPTRFLWREMMGAFQVSSSPASTGVSVDVSRHEKQKQDNDDRMAVDDEDEVDVAATSHTTPLQVDDSTTLFMPSPADALSEIFRTRCSVAAPTKESKTTGKSPGGKTSGKRQQ